ncbi:MAG: glycosyltransferase family 4 protein, partial [Bacteroidota bacterium]|nr:glycosyltransferase family 4 protein [Bacteroidota bacterium]
VIRQKGVEYHFKKMSRVESWFPFRLHIYLSKLQPDVVVVHGLVFPLQVIMLRQQLGSRIKIALMHHAERPFNRYRRWFQRIADRFVDTYFFNSVQHSREWIETKIIRNPAKVIEVMIGSSVFYPVDRSLAREKIFVPDGVMYLWVGQLDVNKDPRTLIKAFKTFAAGRPTARLFMIYQNDDLLGEIKDLVDDFPRISLIGRVNHAELLHWYNSADFIVSTSHRESGGIAVCEAMSCGCIPILADIPSFQMMTDNGRVGFLFPPGNPQALLDVLVKSESVVGSVERKRVLDHFRVKLSSEAIVDKMMKVFTSPATHE